MKIGNLIEWIKTTLEFSPYRVNRRCDNTVFHFNS